MRDSMAKKGNKLVYSTRDPVERQRGKKATSVQTRSLPPPQQTIYVLIDRKQRRGKSVTVCRGFKLTPKDLKTLEKQLKQFCGAGGTSKGDEIEIQGEHRDKVMQKLAELNYKVKRSGG